MLEISFEEFKYSFPRFFQNLYWKRKIKRINSLKLDYFIDSAYLNNIENIQIVHGIGTGALKDAIHKYLKLQKNIKTFNFATQANGGYGMTEAILI